MFGRDTTYYLGIRPHPVKVVTRRRYIPSLAPPKTQGLGNHMILHGEYMMPILDCHGPRHLLRNFSESVTSSAGQVNPFLEKKPKQNGTELSKSGHRWGNRIQQNKLVLKNESILCFRVLVDLIKCFLLIQTHVRSDRSTCLHFYANQKCMPIQANQRMVFWKRVTQCS